ncbi:MAG: inorganic phosphate transporter [Eubacteriales bacterium]|nr:inorganic phosphate transporter [Eubacteriales bacterium]
MLYFALAAVSAVIFVNGWTDAPNAVAACVGSRSMTAGRAVIMAAFFDLIGALLALPLGAGVAQNVYYIADFGRDGEGLPAMCAGMCAVVVWAVAAWWFGIPTSESHALLAGLSGAALARGGIGALDSRGWGGVCIGLVLSTLPAFLLGRAGAGLIFRVFRRADRPSVMPAFVRAQRLGAATGAMLHGLQDGQKFMGIIALTLAAGRGETAGPGFRLPLGVVIYCALLMAAGTALGGRRIIKRVALDMVSLDPPRGVAADIASAVCLGGCTLAGLPVSTTHARTCAVLGAGKPDVRNRGAVRGLFAAWGLTFPACGALGYGFALLFMKLAG